MQHVNRRQPTKVPFSWASGRQIVVYESLGFLLAIAVCWVTEVLDPPFSFSQVIIETLGILIVGVFTLINTIAAAEKLRMVNNALLQSNKDLERFAYVASHDLQEPLRVITGFIGLLQRRYTDKLDAKGEEFIRFVVEASQRMQQLITELLDYARVGRERRVDAVDVSRLVNAVLLNLRKSIEETRAVITVDPLPTVMANTRELSQVFQNLIGNAIKFRREDVPVTIHIGSRKKEGQWVFFVRDNGIGIAADQCDRIFEVFQRLHARDAYAGTGIGLAIVRKVAEEHGGAVWVESEIGKGSTFHFSLPMGTENLRQI
jgi:light-regulated signal transduction histidine kinase (bacteriophytochrome)